MPPIPQRRKKSSTKFNLIVAFVFHLVIFLLLGFWAAHEGALGKKLQEITVAIVPPEKKPEPEPEKPPPPKFVEPPKTEPKVVEPPKTVIAPPPQAPPRSVAPVVAQAPAAVNLPDFKFDDGAKPVETGTNSPISSYKGQLEYTLRANWDRPTDIIDDSYVAEVEVTVDPFGRITGSAIKKGSGDPRWDDSVKKAIASTRSLNQPPPAGFPGKVIVRFDVLPVSRDLLQ